MQKILKGNLSNIVSACLCDNTDKTTSKMKGDIVGIGSTLLQSEMGSTNKSHWPHNKEPYELEAGYRKTSIKTLN